MNRSLCHALGAAAVALAAASQLSADDWPQWRGANRDGRSAETGLLPAGPQAGPRKAWSAAGFGAGFSSVAVAGGFLYTMGDLKGEAAGQYLIAASVPPPRHHTVRYAGVLAAASQWRSRIAPCAEPDDIAWHLARIGEPTELPERSPDRGPPCWASTILRRKALGDQEG